MNEAHKKAVTDFGIPDKLILADDVKLWRFTGTVDVVFREESWAWPEVVPVMSGDKTIGAATIYPMGESLVASVTATYDLPERLDFENGESLTLLAKRSEIDGVLTIEYLDLVQDNNSSTPISNWEVL